MTRPVANPAVLPPRETPHTLRDQLFLHLRRVEEGIYRELDVALNSKEPPNATLVRELRLYILDVLSHLDRYAGTEDSDALSLEHVRRAFEALERAQPDKSR